MPDITPEQRAALRVPDLSLACSCQCEHMPHDGCDGRPQIARLLDAADERDVLRERLAEVTADRDALVADLPYGARIRRTLAGR